MTPFGFPVKHVRRSVTSGKGRPYKATRRTKRQSGACCRGISGGCDAPMSADALRPRSSSDGCARELNGDRTRFHGKRHRDALLACSVAQSAAEGPPGSPHGPPMGFTRDFTAEPGTARGGHRGRWRPPLSMEINRSHSPIRGRFTGNSRCSCSGCRTFSADERRATFHAKRVSAQARLVGGALWSTSGGAAAYALDALSLSRRVTPTAACRTDSRFHGERTSPPDPSADRGRKGPAPASLPVS